MNIYEIEKKRENHVKTIRGGGGEGEVRWLIIRPCTLRINSHACQFFKWGPLNEKQVVIKKTCLGYVKCIVSMAVHNAILKNWDVPTKYSYLSSISPLNNIRGTKLKLKTAVTH